ncbi:MAG: hypothetical protein ACYDBI_05675 [Thermoplasmataceae archaeon]
MGFKQQNSHFEATWVSTQNNWEPWTYGSVYYEYSGPSYMAATSMQIYLPMQG